MKYICFVFVICCLIYEGNNSLIKVDDKGYTGIVVGFSRKIETGQKELLQNLKDLFNEASGVLFNITSQRAYFKEITFLIPQSWSKENLFGPEEESTVHKVGLERYNEADIFLESESGFFQNNPYTIQIAGCAKQGLGIHFSRTYLLEKDRARNLIYEWMKYRYGVFDEHGFQGDERYPLLYGLPGNSTFKKVTSCSNRAVDYMETADIRKCTINAKTGRVVDSTCSIEIKSEQTDASSSFMFSSKMMHLCGKDHEYIHDYNSPTKHNALCFENSISEVISRHKDFRNSGSQLVDLAPTFRYVQESHHLRLVLAIDNSKDISSRKVDELLKKVVYKFLEFSIVKGQPVDLVFYNSQNKTIVKSYEDNLFFPRTPYTDPGCIKCALRDSMKVLEKHEVIEGSTLVLIVRHTLTDDEIKILHDDYESKNIRVHVILCLVDEQPARPLESEFAETGIRVQYVPMETEKTEHFLYGALQSSVRDDTFGTAEDNIVIMQQSFKDSKSFLNFTFPVDERAKREVKILVSPFNMVYEDNNLVSVNNKNYDVESSVKFSALSNADITMLELSSEIEPGKVSMSLRKEEGPVDVIVLAKESSVLSAIIVRCWLSSSSQFINVDNRSEPIIFYTEVRSGNFPVRNARVEATLHHPDQSETSYILTDDGIGDPDITKDDGIYSRYITGFSTKGQYILTVLVTDNEEKTEIITETVRDGRCCGSVIPSVRAVLTGKFSRVYNYGSFYVSLAMESGDFYPPSRITDLAVIDIREAIDPWRMYLTFEFSSPGGNYNNDEVSHINIRYFKSRSLIKDFDHAVIPEDFYIQHKIISGRYGEKKNIDLEMPEIKLRQLKAPGDIVFFAIQAMDESGNKGEPSNVVEVYLPIPSPSTKSPPLNSTSGTGDDGGDEGEADHQIDDSQKKMTSGQVGMIVGIIIGCIILLVAMAVAAFLFTRRKNTKKPKQNRALPENNKLQKVSNEYLSDDAMKAPVSISDPISPVQSWPANVLMDHYDKMQEAKRKNGSDVSIDSSSGDSSHPLKPNPIYEGGTDDRYRENNRYSPTAPYSSSQSSLNKTPRNVTQV